MRRTATLMLFALASCALCGGAASQIPDGRIRVGVLSDFSGPFADSSGKGSLVAAQMAAEDFAAEAGDLKVEIVSADHQNKADVGATIARRWVDQEGVAAIVDLPNSAVALAVSAVMKDRNRVMMASGTASSDLTGVQCQPTTVQWALDTWALGHATARAITEAGGKSWFFISFDYALGRALQRDTSEAIKALGGQVVGAVYHPLNTPDFASYLLQAGSSGADVIALGSAGHDLVNAVKQADEFHVSGGKRLVALLADINEIDTIGLDAAQGLTVSLPFYWDLNDSTRAWSKRYAAHMSGRMPTYDQSATYSATLAYLRAAKAANSIEADKVLEKMRAAPIADPLYGTVTLRNDGRAVHEMYVFRVKPPGQSKGPHDDLELVRTIPSEQAFRSIGEGGCRLIQ